MLVPLIVFLMRNTIIFPRTRLTYAIFIGTIVTALATVVGTGARTGMIAVGVLCVQSMIRSKKKLWWIAGLAVAGIVFMNVDLSHTRWGARMSTVGTYNKDGSALGRIKVWEWTIGYIGDHPLGGGFDAFLHNRIAGVSDEGVVVYYPEGQIRGKAFHSVYFEVLGEQGIPGFAMYFSMVLISLLKLRKLKKQWRGHPELGWLAELADALISAILVFLAGGAFVGIAYQPFIFYMISLTVALEHHSMRVLRETQIKAKESVTT
jgi:probable O-glycosylation ligase (exosortase A-associated)